MRVSVITVVRNGERFLQRALLSIQRQTYPAHEIIVVDGHSSDNTAHIAQANPRITYLLQPDEGLANARNLGVAAASGDLIAFLDHDDIWRPEKLARQVDLQQADPGVMYSLTQMVFQLEPGAAMPPGMIAQSLAQPRTAGTPSALVARKELFAQIGGFDPRFAIACDAEWFTRARDLAIATTTVSAVLLYKQLHNANLSRNIQLNRREMFQVARESIARRR